MMKDIQFMTWNWKASSLWQRLLLALLIVAAASVFRAMFFASLGRGIPYILYYPAVMLAAIYGGLAAGLLATVLSTSLTFFWIQRGFTSPPELLALVIFIVSCAMVSFVGEAVRQAQERVTLAQEKTEAVNQELRRETAERQQAEAALRESEERYRMLFDDATDGIMLLSPEGQILAVSESFARPRGYSKEEMVRMSLKDLETPESFQKFPHRPHSQLLAGESCSFEVEHRHKDGHVLQCEVSASRIFLRGEKVIQSSHRDITARQQAGEEIRQRNRELAAITQIVTATATNLDFQTVLDRALRSVLELTHLEGGTLCLVDHATQTLNLAAEINASPEVVQDLTTHLIKIGDCLCGACAKTCQPLIIWDNASGSRFATREATRNEGIRFHAAFPLSVMGACTGVLCIFAKSAATPAKRTLELVQQLCGPIALAIENARLFKAAQQELAERKLAEETLRSTDRALKTISACNQALVRATEEPGLLQQVCQAIVEQGGYRMAWLGFAMEGENKPVQIAASSGFEEGYLENACISWSEDDDHGCGPAGIAIRTGQMVVCNDFQDDPKTEPWWEEAAKRGYAAMISLPLRNAGQSFGALSIYAACSNAFHDTEIKLLSELADDLAFGINAMRNRARHKLMEETILQERDFSNVALDSLPGLFYLFELQGRFLRFNKNLERVSGCSTDELSRMSILDLFEGADKGRARDAIQQVLKTGEAMVELEIVSRDRTRTPFVFMGKRFQFEQKPCVMGTGIDLTERKQLEEQLRQSQKMEAIGHLAGGVAHDFNNILAALILQVDLLECEKQLPEGVEDGLKLIRADAERAANLVRQLLLFSRRQVMRPRDLDLNEVVTNFSKMLQRIIGEDIQIQLHLHTAPLPIHADAGMIEQVLMNLAANARDAMPKGGRLLIELTAATADEARARRFNAEAAPGRFVCLGVGDTGTGIPLEVMPRIFEPFFTTKDLGKGTGLGLATVFGIAKQHKGWVEVDNHPGKGVTFLVYFPALAATATEPTLAGPLPKPLGGTETILLVEDESEVRRVVRTLLAQSGYDVLEAANGKEALALAQGQGRSLALLLTDLIMPEGLNGLELANQLKSEKPQLKVVYISGYSTEVAGGKLGLQEGVNFLQKPFNAEHLLQTIRQSLDG